MANIDILLPFLLHWETGIGGSTLRKPLPEMFLAARKRGFANDPRDLGGATQCGVTIGTYKAYCRRKGYPVPTVERLRNIPYEQWHEIVKTMFWDRWKADSIVSQPIANLLVDWLWHSGANGIKLPQKVLGVTQDGIVGAKTLAAVNSSDPKSLFDRLHAERIASLRRIVERRPSQAVFLNGWLNRVNAITYGGLEI